MRCLVLAAIGLALLAVVVSPVKGRFTEQHACGTQEVWTRHSSNRTLPAAPVCVGEGTCDDPTVRDAAPWNPMTINTVVHVFNSATGKAPNGVGLTKVDQQMTTLNEDFEPYNIQFTVQDVLFHNDGDFYCLSAYGQNGDEWYYQIQELKDKYAVSPTRNINIFITCQDQGDQGTLLGIGTFPWDESATTSLGGLWLNSASTGSGLRTLSHEMGHTLGLWHTFHGVSEVTGCRDACYEDVHSPFDAAADDVGDFCADTPATPLNYECSAPAGSDCTRVSWGDTDVSNIMSYSPDECMNHFTEDQAARMHCWVCDAISGVVAKGC